MVITLTFESTLKTTRAALWERILSVEGIREEMMPFLVMKTPKGVRSLADIPFEPGKAMFRALHLYGGFLPLDYSDLTLVEMQPGHHFLERSPMLSMKSWQHRREILDVPGRADHQVLRDTLTFEPRLAAGLAAWFVARFFRHRHAMLRRAHPETWASAASSPSSVQP